MILSKFLITERSKLVQLAEIENLQICGQIEKKKVKRLKKTNYQLLELIKEQ